MLHTAPEIKSCVGILFSFAQGNLARDRVRNRATNSQEWQKDDNPLPGTGETCAEWCVCEPTTICESPDDQYLETVFENLRQKFNLSEDAEMFHQKTDVLIWGFFLFNNDAGCTAFWATLQ